MIAFVGSLLVAFVLIGVIVRQGKRRPVGTPLTWGEAMVAAVFVFFCMFWAYGVVPEAWINYFQNGLQWRPDQLLTGPHGTLVKGPVSFSKAALGDIITTIIYAFMIGMHISLFLFWGKRGRAQADAARRDQTRQGKRRPMLSRKGQLT